MLIQAYRTFKHAALVGAVVLALAPLVPICAYLYWASPDDTLDD